MRIGYVPYLNTYPLIYKLESFLPGDELIGEPPAQLAKLMENREIEVGLIPIVEYFRHPEYKLISDAVIACDGAVRSVCVYSKVPIEEIKSLQLEPQSRTSNMLVRIILKHRYGVTPELKSMPADIIGAPIKEDEVDCDACLGIGNRSLRMEATWPYEIDLGEEWKKLTGLPFVFAAWLAQGDVVAEKQANAFSAARDCGVGNLDTIIDSAAQELALPIETCRDYLTDKLHYHLTSECKQAIELFKKYFHEFETEQS